MNDIAPKSLSHSLFTGLVFASLFFGAVGGLGVLFVGDTLFDKTPDDTAQFDRLADELDAARARINALETALAQKSENAANTAALEAELSTLRDTATILGARVDTLDKNDSNAQIPLILLGITQLKTAFENDQPLDAGITTLTGAVNDDAVKKMLGELGTAAASLVPLDTLIRDAEKLRADMAAASQTKTVQTGNALRDGATNLLNQFVTVRPAGAVAHDKTLETALMALRGHDLPTARAHLGVLPPSPALQTIITALDTRLAVAAKLRAVMAAVTGVTNTGTLY